MLSRVDPWPYPQTLEGLERLARDQRASLLQKSVTYDRKKFYKIDTWIIKVDRVESKLFPENQRQILD